ncbi:conserved hypothetical protein [Candida tropicalis MYA-3404]|uniref:LYC1 C-terminal domain-containing protein n=1 Tax=Candida tropicalis (strain ATCC MYA-3404 / T1) TaxID=294747 RepID=C5MDU1_CANTT|nr:conserved hypothetical protein [Candida tropicalis MYA-3404]EER32172.1 conserved hypothetical protein [Candida tropicalis MYA-3404]KAG4405771.1 hypothetical protein JTP64_004642 [Candida tropicalis]
MPSSIQPEEFELVHLTDKQIIEFTRSQNAQSWKGALSTKDYVLREHVLGKSRMATTSPNRLLVFMLKKISNNTPLCSIELLIRKSKRFEYKDGNVEEKEILSGCIGGVYTYPEHRGNGYARIMVDKLVTIGKEIIGEDGFIFLYSEVGEYYAKNGFLSLGVDLINVPLLDSSVEDINESFEMINYHEFDELMDIYKNQFEKGIIDKITKDKLTRISVIPHSNIIDWFHLRSKYISYKLFYESKDLNPIDFYNESYEHIKSRLSAIEPQKFGIKLFNSQNIPIGFIIWTMDYNYETMENYVTVLKIVSLEDETKKDEISIKLLKLMKNYLIKSPILDMKTNKIVIWESEISNSVKQFLVDEWKSKTGIENSSRSAILMNNSKDDEQLRDGKVIWEGNDKLPWF